jgi:hypothetical protein
LLQRRGTNEQTLLSFLQQLIPGNEGLRYDGNPAVLLQRLHLGSALRRYSIIISGLAPTHQA